MIECQWLFDPGAAGRDGFDPSFAVDFWDITNRQDWAACEACNAASARGATGRDRSAATRTRSPASPASSPTPTSTAASQS